MKDYKILGDLLIKLLGKKWNEEAMEGKVALQQTGRWMWHKNLKYAEVIEILQWGTNESFCTSEQHPQPKELIYTGKRRWVLIAKWASRVRMFNQEERDHTVVIEIEKTTQLIVTKKKKVSSNSLLCVLIPQWFTPPAFIKQVHAVCGGFSY